MRITDDTLDAIANALALRLDLAVLRGEWRDGLVSTAATRRRIRPVAARHHIPEWQIGRWVFGNSRYDHNQDSTGERHGT